MADKTNTYFILSDVMRQPPQHDGLALPIISGFSTEILLCVVSVRVIAVF